jgi:pSer/pThr/pTyr-binding forkhead associated (FHA) protein
MGLVTFQAVDGLERGSLFEHLATPINIGREEDNQIRLNDERVSRFHAKVQEQDGKYILTDLDSTNGTRVNGHPVTMHVLQIGDQVHIGRCLLIFGSPEQLAARSAPTDADDPRGTVESVEDRATSSGDDECPELFRHGPPPLPERLSGIQTAQTEDVLAYLHNTLLRALYSVEADPEPTSPLASVQISAKHWHRLQQLQVQLAAYLRAVGQPSDS